MNFSLSNQLVLGLCSGVLVSLAVAPQAIAEQRNEVSYLRGPYNTKFFYRENKAFRVGAGLHFAHSAQHDVLLTTDFKDREKVDDGFARQSLSFLYEKLPRTEPNQEYYAPYTTRAMLRVLRTIDWTHQLHEQTYDIMSDAGIAWKDKKAYLDRAVDYYLHAEQEGIPRSVAPIDVTMRRAGVMMKPYFTYFRNSYPKSNNFFYGAHWWHPVIYEAQMIAGNDEEQERSVAQAADVYYSEVLKDEPLRMLLTREAMPRWARLSPEAGNIFDNLHMLHGIVYDILAYPDWNVDQKRAEIYRVIQAMSYQPGDEKLVRKFSEPHPDMDPRVYAEWMRGSDGEMNRIMFEMMDEMMPVMMGEGMQAMDPAMHDKMIAQMKMKLAPGLQEGEIPGSLQDAMRKLMPAMQRMPEAMEPGQAPQKMIDAMLAGWQQKYRAMPDIEPISMDADPVLPPLKTASSGN